MAFWVLRAPQSRDSMEGCAAVEWRGGFYVEMGGIGMKIAIRGFANGKRQFEDRAEIEEANMDSLLPDLAEKHAAAMAAHELHHIEIEFLDELNPNTRFFRFGTDPSGMFAPIA